MTIVRVNLMFPSHRSNNGDRLPLVTSFCYGSPYLYQVKPPFRRGEFVHVNLTISMCLDHSKLTT